MAEAYQFPYIKKLRETGEIIPAEDHNKQELQLECITDAIGDFDFSGLTITEQLENVSVSLALDDLTNVNVASPSNGEVLTFQSSSGTWIASPTGAISLDLDDLNDVNVPAPSDGEVLTFSGGIWVSATVAQNLDDLSDVNVPTPNSGEVLTFTGAQWESQEVDFTTDLLCGNPDLVFGTGGACTPRWRIDETGDFLAVDDNTYDIGSEAGTDPGVNRPRRVYVGTELVVGDGTVRIDNNSILASDGLTIQATGTGDDITLIASTVNILGDLIVDGGVTSISTTNLVVEDQLILLANGASNQIRSGLAIERGSSGDDAILYFNTSPLRFELGFFDTNGGLTPPSGPLASLADLRINDLDLVGTLCGDPDLTFGTGTTGCSPRWRIDETGDFLAVDDNTYDIGSEAGTDPGVNRPRRVYVGTELVVGDGTVSITTDTVTVGAAGSGTVTCPGTGTDSEQFGSGASATADNTLAIGSSSAASANNSIAIGRGSIASNQQTVALGDNAIAGTAGGNRDCTAIGSSTQAESDNSIAIGANATTPSGGSDNMAIGTNAVAGSGVQTNCLAIGVGASVTVAQGIGIGNSGSISAGSSIGIGDSVDIAGSSSIGIGGTVQIAAGHNQSIALGDGASTTGSNQLVIGGSSAEILTVYIGEGVSSADPGPLTIQGTRTNTSETDTPGSTVTIAAGEGTGAATPSRLIFQTPGITASGTAQQALATRLEIFEEAVEFSTDLTFSIDDAFDIGSEQGTNPGVNRPRRVYVGTEVVVGDATVSITTDTVTVGAAGSGTVTCPGAGASSEQFGSGASSDTANSTAIGALATCTVGTQAIAIGANASTSAGNAIAIGAGASSANGNGVAIGQTASVTADNSFALGRNASCAFASCVAIGTDATVTKINQLMIGSDSNLNWIDEVVIGEGESSNDPVTTVTLRTTRTNTSQTDVAGSSWIIQSGAGTGASDPSTISFQTPSITGSGSAQQTLATRLELSEEKAELTADLTFSVDNFYDIGSEAGTDPGINRPRRISVGTEIVIGDDLSIDNNSISANDGLTIEATGPGNTEATGQGDDITIIAGDFAVVVADISTQWSEDGDRALDASFSATSIIGAINELKISGGASDTYTNGNASTITQGQCVYITTTANTVDLADATSDSAAAQIIGFVQPTAGIASSASGIIATFGSVVARFVGGLTLTPGDEVFLSTTAGSITNVAPSTSGNVVQSLGFIKDTLTYDGASDFLAEIHFVLGSKSVV